jgi:hypothetical protein
MFAVSFKFTPDSSAGKQTAACISPPAFAKGYIVDGIEFSTADPLERRKCKASAHSAEILHLSRISELVT